MQKLQTVSERFTGASRNVKKTAGRALLAAAATAAMIGTASAQDNDGVSAIVSAINGLKPDLGTVVVAGIGVALVGIGAAVAISVGKRIMGK